MKTIDEKYEMMNAWKNGKTYEEIGKMYGLTRQRVQQIVTKMIKNDIDDSRVKNIIYPGLKKYMYNNQISITELALKCECPYPILRSALQKEGEIDIALINKILAITGMTFEACFVKEQSIFKKGD